MSTISAVNTPAPHTFQRQTSHTLKVYDGQEGLYSDVHSLDPGYGSHNSSEIAAPLRKASSRNDLLTKSLQDYDLRRSLDASARGLSNNLNDSTSSRAAKCVFDARLFEAKTNNTKNNNNSKNNNAEKPPPVKSRTSFMEKANKGSTSSSITSQDSGRLKPDCDTEEDYFRAMQSLNGDTGSSKRNNNNRVRYPVIKINHIRLIKDPG